MIESWRAAVLGFQRGCLYYGMVGYPKALSDTSNTVQIFGLTYSVGGNEDVGGKSAYDVTRDRKIQSTTVLKVHTNFGN